jgi:Cu(I)/Ag(I) efflux system periplasmic protein CusF
MPVMGAIANRKESQMKYLKLVSMFITALAVPAYAQQPATDRSAHHVAQTKYAGLLTDGEVRKVDKDAKKLTIRHGPIQNLDMPAMTMVFQVKDQAMLDKVNAGDKVKFSAEKIGGALTVTGIEPAK